MAWDFRNFIKPLAPGMSGAINPLTFIGSGMATGDIGGSLARMTELQQAGQRLAMQQAQAQAAMAQARAEAEQVAKVQALAPGVAKEMFPGSANMQGLLAANPALLMHAMKQRMQPAKPTSLQQNLTWALGLPEGDPRREAAIQAVTKPQTSITNIPSPPSGYMYGQQSSGGMPTLEEIPGGPIATKREAERAKKIAPLDALQDSLNRYKATLDKYGPEFLAGEGRAALATDYGDLLIKRKEAANLGALTGPDLDLMTSSIMDPTGLTAQWYEKTGQTEAIKKQLERAQQALDDARARARGEEPKPRRTMGTEENPAQVANDADYDALKPGDYYVGPDGVTRVK